MKVDLDWVHHKLQEVVNHAYTPFSKFKVACMLVANNQAFYGVNIENASYPVTLCAERSAIANMVTSIGKATIDYVFVYFDTKTPTNSPCGMCRQNIFEFATDKTQLFCIEKDKSFKQFTIPEIW